MWEMNNKSIALKHRVSIPEGPLFYPCAGNDTTEPLNLFMDSISEFHFVDNMMVSNLPKLEVEIIGYKEKNNTHSRASRSTEGYFPKEIVVSAKGFEPQKDTIDLKKIACLTQYGINCAGSIKQTGTIYKQIWQLTNNKKIEIYRHLQDGLATFISLDKIAVFYLQGDSLGEGGSGQKWFQNKLFDIILDKLMDGGLIVTDGSGYDYKIVDKAEWKSLWVNKNVKRNDIHNVDIPKNFEYYNRKFNCLGKCGYKYGPVYVWLVTQIK